jgi:hypothetical protein
MKRAFRWDPSPPNLQNEALFGTLQASPVGKDAVLLHYHKDPPDPASRRSIGGTGYFQLFRLPDGERGALLSVEIFGCRYGGAGDDQADVAAWVCDPEMRVLKERKFPYRDLNGGESAWMTLPWEEAIEVPRFFFVGVHFDATASRGYLMGIQKGVSGHSYTGTPKVGLSLLEGQEWVFRVKVGKAGKR